MTPHLDLIYLTTLTLALLLDHFVGYRLFLRRVRQHPRLARLVYWSVWMIMLWAFTAAGMILWRKAERPWDLLGFKQMEGWGGWVAVLVILSLIVLQARGALKVARSAKARESVRRQYAGLTAILPHDRIELLTFFALSLTAGFCEEFIFRGYLIRVVQPSAGWVGAVAISLIAFALGHSYQGATGILRTGIVGAILTLVFWISGSLWPAIVLHILIDIGSGLIAWLVLREA